MPESARQSRAARLGDRLEDATGVLPLASESEEDLAACGRRSQASLNSCACWVAARLRRSRLTLLGHRFPLGRSPYRPEAPTAGNHGLEPS